ncbi:hypothetical protein D3C72_1064900 [compost metagenome]
MLPSRQRLRRHDLSREQIHLGLQQHTQPIFSCNHGGDFIIADHLACGSLVIRRHVYAPRMSLDKACAVRAQIGTHWDMSSLLACRYCVTHITGDAIANVFLCHFAQLFQANLRVSVH